MFLTKTEGWTADASLGKEVNTADFPNCIIPGRFASLALATEEHDGYTTPSLIINNGQTVITLYNNKYDVQQQQFVELGNVKLLKLDQQT